MNIKANKKELEEETTNPWCFWVGDNSSTPAGHTPTLTSIHQTKSLITNAPHLKTHTRDSEDNLKDA